MNAPEIPDFALSVILGVRFRHGIFYPIDLTAKQNGTIVRRHRLGWFYLIIHYARHSPGEASLQLEEMFKVGNSVQLVGDAEAFERARDLAIAPLTR